MGNSKLNCVFLWFIIVGLIGVYLRGLPLDFYPLLFEYRFWVHAHSHLALLGWLFTVLYVFMLRYFVHLEKHDRYTKLFNAIQVANVGMLLGFPVQGYGFFSISFSALYIICSYVFAIRFYTDVKQNSGISPINKTLALCSVFFLALSTLGAWGLGPIMAMGLKHTTIYRLSIYFFLHFIINGWLVVAFVALLRQHYSEIFTPPIHDKRNVLWLAVSVLLTYFLSTLWLNPPIVVHILSGFAALIQFYALFHLFIRPFFKYIVHQKKNLINRLILSSLILALVLKLMLQLVSSVPVVAVLAEAFPVFIIAHLHLILLGFASLSALLLLKNTQFPNSRIFNVGILTFLVSFIVSEKILVWQGLMQAFHWWSLAHQPKLLFLASSGMLVGIFVIVFSFFRTRKTDL